MNKSDPSWERAMKNWRSQERKPQHEAKREQGKAEKPVSKQEGRD